MTPTRRSFLGTCAAALAGLAMVRLPERWTLPVLYGDGVHDDWPALQAMVDGARVWSVRDERVLQPRETIVGGTYLLSRGIRVTPGAVLRLNNLTLKSAESFPSGAALVTWEPTGIQGDLWYSGTRGSSLGKNPVPGLGMVKLP